MVANMTEPTPAAFWSYAHQDDEQDGGRILRLASRIREEYSLITGTDLQMFVDRNDNKWGVVWRERIDSALQETTFFIPVVTPRYFTRTECRGELMKFASAASALGVQELLLPIRYIPIKNYTESNSDEAIGLTSAMQYVDWYQLRLADEQSEKYRAAVNGLAERLAELTESISSRPASVAITMPISISGNAVNPYEQPDAPGLADLLAEFEPALARLTEILERGPEVMESFSKPIARATAELSQINAQGKPFGARIVIFRELAVEIEEPSKNMEAIGKEYSAELLAADPAVRAFIEVANDLVRDDSNPAGQAAGREALQSVQGMVDASRENLISQQGLSDAVRANVRLSRDLRPALLRIETGVRSFIDAQALLEEWARLVEGPGPLA